MSEFTVCTVCLEPLYTEQEKLETGRCEDCQRDYERNTYDPMFDDRVWDELRGK